MTVATNVAKAGLAGARSAMTSGLGGHVTTRLETAAAFMNSARMTRARRFTVVGYSLNKSRCG